MIQGAVDAAHGSVAGLMSKMEMETLDTAGVQRLGAPCAMLLSLSWFFFGPGQVEAGVC